MNWNEAATSIQPCSSTSGGRSGVTSEHRPRRAGDAQAAQADEQAACAAARFVDGAVMRATLGAIAARRCPCRDNRSHERPHSRLPLRAAEPRDVNAIVGLIRELAEFESSPTCCRRLRRCTCTCSASGRWWRRRWRSSMARWWLRALLHQLRPSVQAGLYLEDLRAPLLRGRHRRRLLLRAPAAIAVERGYGALSGACSTGTATPSASTRRWARRCCRLAHLPHHR